MENYIIFVKVAKPGETLYPQASSWGGRQFPHIAAFVVMRGLKLFRFWTDLKNRSSKPYEWVAKINEKGAKKFRSLKPGGPVAHSSQPLYADEYEVITVEQGEALL